MATATKKIGVDDLDHRLRQNLNRRATKLVNNLEMQARIKTQLQPLQAKLSKLQHEEREIRDEFATKMVSSKLQGARLHLDKALVEMAAPRLSVEVLDLDLVPNDYIQTVRSALKPAILKEWKAWNGTERGFYKEIPGVQIMEGSYALKVTI